MEKRARPNNLCGRLRNQQQILLVMYTFYFSNNFPLIFFSKLNTLTLIDFTFSFLLNYFLRSTVSFSMIKCYTQLFCYNLNLHDDYISFFNSNLRYKVMYFTLYQIEVRS